MTLSNNLADQIGQLDAQIKVLTKELNALKDKAKASGLNEIEGRIFTVTIRTDIFATLDSASVKKELGQKWYDDHCKLGERMTLTVKARPETLANI